MKNIETEIIIVGAGAAGLMAARELSKADKKVIILEARNRTGGRIMPLDEKEFGYPAQGGAEFVHGDAPITKAFAKETGVTLFQTKGDMWHSRDGELTMDGQRIPGQEVLYKKLKELKEDMSVSDFLDTYFSDEKYKILRDDITRMVQGYDAADPKKASIFAVREEWLSSEWSQQRIKEGYGKLLDHLVGECKKMGVSIYLETKVMRIVRENGKVFVHCAEDKIFQAKKIIVTVPISILDRIKFVPAIEKKILAASKIGFGGVIKVLLRFEDRWWLKARGKDFTEMDFLLSHDAFPAWWTQNPNPIPVLTAWLAGPKTEKFAKSSSEKIVNEALSSLADIFKIEKSILKKKLILSKVMNWVADPMTRGGYSYETVETPNARRELKEPIDDVVYFAGEALGVGKQTATVEGALGSGLETAKKILMR